MILANDRTNYYIRLISIEIKRQTWHKTYLIAVYGGLTCISVFVNVAFFSKQIAWNIHFISVKNSTLKIVYRYN